MAVLVAATRAAAEVARRTSTSKNVRAAAEVVASPKRSGRRLVALAIAGAFAAMLLMTAVFGGGASAVHPSCAVENVVVFDDELEQVLATIRTLESGHDYQAINNGNGYNRATGAYQFLRSSWASYGGYPEAWQAPPATQDAKAAEWATAILQEHGGDVAAVPVAWYVGHVPAPDSARWDTVPVPSAGNTLTLREYQAKWMSVYVDPAAHAEPTASPAAPDGDPTDEPAFDTCTGVVGEGEYRIPDGVTQLVASNISWGGYANGQIPLDAMRYSPTSNYMHPSASAAWDQLHAAAAAEGYDLRGNGYRPASAGGATSGNSNHGWGLAVDVQVLVIDSTNPTTVDAAFASDEYRWLVKNAPLYGFLNPAWAKPPSLGGNGNGGHVGDQCCFLEPWHWEWAAFMNTLASDDPDAA